MAGHQQMTTKPKSRRDTDTIVGEVRPSQLMYTYGVGAIVDLPKLSAIVLGLDYWSTHPDFVREVTEDRLLNAVRFHLPSVRAMRTAPVVPDTGNFDPFQWTQSIGVQVATFPRWLVCPACRTLAPLNSGLFHLDANRFVADRTSYRHVNCNKARRPEAVPARVMVACESGHLDDFPWVDFVHRSGECTGAPMLRLLEYGTSGETRDLEVRCDTCGSARRLAEAFGRDNAHKMPMCTGRRPHLKDYDPGGCENRASPIALGASNLWFPVVMSVVALPVEGGEVIGLVKDRWSILQNVKSMAQVSLLRSIGQLGGELYDYSDSDIWDAIQNFRSQQSDSDVPLSAAPDLKSPEWDVFVRCDPKLNTGDFLLREIELSEGWGISDHIAQIVLVERMREARAMIGFTRMDASGELTDPDLAQEIEPATLTRTSPSWIPAVDVRGEGIFVRLDEGKVQEWESKPCVQARAQGFVESHARWRTTHGIDDPQAGFPGIRYVLIHTFAHALMRQLALECGYGMASLKERIYARTPEMAGGPMAGVLIYTAASDSEGTLGGLVTLGEAGRIEEIIDHALWEARTCASDPLCAESEPDITGRAIHACACHACVLAPETSCERGNKYLDRGCLVPVFGAEDDLAYFGAG